METLFTRTPFCYHAPKTACVDETRHRQTEAICEGEYSQFRAGNFAQCGKIDFV